MRIFFLNGFHGSGKDTFGKLLTERLKFRKFVRVAMADTIKDLGSETYKFDRKLADDHFEKDKKRDELDGKSIREVCRYIAEIKQREDPTCFSRIACKKMRKQIEIDDEINFVITDFRYRHDYDEIVSQFGLDAVVTIHINRKFVTPPNRETEPEEYALEHFKFDYNIDNNGIDSNNLDNLFKICEFIVGQVFGCPVYV
jgi:hypothetical protein